MRSPGGPPEQTGLCRLPAFYGPGSAGGALGPPAGSPLSALFAFPDGAGGTWTPAQPGDRTGTVRTQPVGTLGAASPSLCHIGPPSPCQDQKKSSPSSPSMPLPVAPN